MYPYGYNLHIGGAGDARRGSFSTSEETKKLQSKIVKKRLQIKKYKILAAKAAIKTVYQYTMTGEFIKEWESCPEIVRQNPHIKLTSLYNCVQHRTSSCYGFIWLYDKKYLSKKLKDNRELQQKKKISYSKRRQKSEIPVFLYSNNKLVYQAKSLADAARYLNMSDSSICGALKNKNSYICKKGILISKTKIL